MDCYWAVTGRSVSASLRRFVSACGGSGDCGYPSSVLSSDVLSSPRSTQRLLSIVEMAAFPCAPVVEREREGQKAVQLSGRKERTGTPG